MKINYYDQMTLGQALKLSGLIQTGGEAKICIQEGKVFLNGKVIRQRGKKLNIGDSIYFHGEKIEIIE